MKSSDELVSRARQLAVELWDELEWESRSEGWGGFWKLKDERRKGTLFGLAAGALGFLSQYAGEGSQWFERARIAWESNAGNSSLETGGASLAETLKLWADEVDRGVAAVLGAEASNVRAIASTDLMEQVHALVQERGVHPAASIVLAGAALETALRGAVDELGLQVTGQPGISAYAKALRDANVFGKQEMKDVEAMGGMRNFAAHGEFEKFDGRNAILMEQQVNLFLAQLAEKLGD
jgi:hypothetical protein